MSVKLVPAANRVYQEFRTDFFKSLDAAPSLWPEYAMEMPSTSKSTLHAWLANNGSVREWLGPRRAKQMSTRSWEIVNKKYELSYAFERDQIDDDLSGLLASAIASARDQGEKWARHADTLMATVLEAGTTALCWDGQFFFDTDHPVDIDSYGSTATYSNSESNALTFANFNTAMVTLRGWKNEEGSPLVMASGLILMVPPALALTAKQIVEIDTLTPGTAYGLFGTAGVSKNPFVGAARVVVNQFLTDTTRWYLIASGMSMKPLVLQRRRPLELGDSGTSSDLYWKEEKIEIGGSARYNGSYGLPQLAYTSKP